MSPGSSSNGVLRNMYGSSASFMAGSQFLRVEVRFVAKLNRGAHARVQRLDGGVRYGSGGIPVPGGRTGRSRAGSEGVDPLLELDVVGADEPFPPIGRNPSCVGAISADHHWTGVVQRGRPLLADDLTPDVVAVLDVHRRLDVGEHPT